MNEKQFPIAATYWGEFKIHWRPLLAATMGLGFGIGLNAYTASLFAPKLIEQFAWERSQFALLGSFALLMLILQPITGKLTDRFGVRIMSAIGVLTSPFIYIAYAMQPGPIWIFFGITILNIIFGTLTTSTVYTRIVAERFKRARGLAFSVVMTGPPLVGGVLAPILGSFIDKQGWSAGYLLVGGLALCFGLLAVYLTPPHNYVKRVETGHSERPKGDLSLIVSNPAFWILIVGMILVNIPNGLASAQLKLVLMDSGAAAQTATWLISAYAVGVIAGRFACGFSLDRLKPHLVAAFALSLPAVGMLLLASPYDAALMLAFSIALIGLAQGAEGDIAAYLVSSRFGLVVFSLAMGMVGASIAGGAALGSVILSLTLSRWDSYTPFLIIGAAATLAGALLFLALGRRAIVVEETNR